MERDGAAAATWRTLSVFKLLWLASWLEFDSLWQRRRALWRDADSHCCSLPPTTCPPMLADAPTLLITDDDSSFRQTLQALFEPRGLRTIEAGDGGEALRIVRTESIHLVLLDLHMPRLGGLETLREVKAMNAVLPCIVLSAGLDPETIAEVREARAYSVLPKPVTRDEVTSTVAAALWDTYGWRWDQAVGDRQ